MWSRRGRARSEGEDTALFLCVGGRMCPLDSHESRSEAAVVGSDTDLPRATVPLRSVPGPLAANTSAASGAVLQGGRWCTSVPDVASLRSLSALSALSARALRRAHSDDHEMAG